MKVEIYWNLHRKLYSVRALEGPRKGRVIGHAFRVLLDDVEFKVNEGGRLRVLREGRKNVHAFVRGKLKACRWDVVPDGLDDAWGSQAILDCDRAFDAGEFVTYNPYRFDSFQAADFREPQTRYRPIKRASRAVLSHAILSARKASMYAVDAA
jgi:hypothetical protein